MLVAETSDAQGNLVQGRCVAAENKIENFLKEMQDFALALANETFTQTASRPHQFAGLCAAVAQKRASLLGTPDIAVFADLIGC